MIDKFLLSKHQISMELLNPTSSDYLTGLLLDTNLSPISVPSFKKEYLENTSTTTEQPILGELSSSPTAQVSPSTETQLVPSSTSLEVLASQPLSDLRGRFSEIELPDTIEFGDHGNAKITILNQGAAIAKGLITVELWLSTDNSLGKNDVLLTSKTTKIKLAAGVSTEVSLDYNNITSAVAPGAYRLLAKIDSNNNIPEQQENNNLTSALVSAPETDIVIDWNATALNVIQAEGEAGRGIGPTLGSRLLAIVSTAVYDTVNAFAQNLEPYALDIAAPANASLEAAIAGAAHEVLITLIPEQARALNQQLASSLKEIDDGSASESAGVDFGRMVARRALALRNGDGSDNDEPYEPPDGDYIWKPDAPNFTALGPYWGKVKPFAMPNMETFKPNGLDCSPTVNPELYAQEIEEVRIFGGKTDTALTKVTRTEDQTELAIFWAYDRPDTFRPYGQLNQITQEVAIREGNSIADNARLFAALNVAMADAVMVAWDAKYKFMQPRPDDVIADGIADNDGIATTVGDPNWQPLLPTPPFPDYISGHSVMGGSWAGVMEHFFGENYQFTAVSQELPGVTRSFDSFYDAAYEDAISRIYGGVHTREATVTDALPTGLEIGQFVAENFFQPIG